MATVTSSSQFRSISSVRSSVSVASSIRTTEFPSGASDRQNHEVTATHDEKKEMQKLNDGLSVYIECARKLEEKNKKLLAALKDIAENWGRTSSEFKVGLSETLVHVRDDEAEATKKLSILKIKAARIKEDITTLKKRCDQLVSAEEYDKASNNHLRELVKKCQNELSLEHDRHVHLHNEECRLNDEYIQRLEDISKINNDIDDERVSLAEYKHKQQKLKEELIFLTEVQKQESISLTKLLSQAPADTREIYKTKIAQTIRDINQEFNNTSQSHRKFLEDHYAGKIKEILNVVKKRDEECRSRQEQVARIEKTLSELNQKFVPLEERKRMQEEECKLLRKTLLEYDEGFKAVLLEKEKQYSNSLDIYQRLLDEKQALLNFEQMLEIAIYKRMLEEEEDRLGIHKVFNEPYSSTSVHRTNKGQVRISDCAKDGKYIAVENIGVEEINLSGYQLRRTIGSRIINYTFPPHSLLLGGQTMKIFARGHCELHQPGTLEFDGQSSWGIGSTIITVLLNRSGQEVATYKQSSA